MRKIHYLGAAIATCIILGVVSIYLFSGLGFSIAKVLNPSFFTSIIETNLISAVLSLVFIGISLGAIFSASRFLGKFQSIGFCAMSGLVMTLIGSIFFWSQINSYTLLAFGLFLGMGVSGFFASEARGSKFSIGSEHAKHVFTVLTIVVFLGAFIMVSLEEDYYKEQFTTSITGLTGSGVGDIDDSTLEKMLRDRNPKPTLEEYFAQIEDYDEYSPEEKMVAENYYYTNFTDDYESSIAETLELTKSNLEGSSGTSQSIMESLSFFKIILDNIALLYAFTLASLVLLAQTIIVAPIAGITSWAFQKPLPEEAQPLPKGEVLRVRWTGE